MLPCCVQSADQEHYFWPVARAPETFVSREGGGGGERTKGVEKRRTSAINYRSPQRAVGVIKKRQPE